MERFKVIIRNGDLEAAQRALDRVGIPTIGPSYAGFGSELELVSNPSNSVLARVDAKDIEDARARVSAVLPEGCEIEKVGSWPPDEGDVD